MTEKDVDKSRITHTQLQRDFDYYRAQIIIQAMLGKGLISSEEYSKCNELNLKSFSPYLADIMAK